MALINRCAGLRPGPVTTILASTKYTLRAIAHRWQQLNDEITTHDKLLTQLTTQAAPELSAAFAVGPDTAAEMLIVAGDNRDRIRSEPAFARRCGVAPIPGCHGVLLLARTARAGDHNARLRAVAGPGGGAWVRYTITS